MMDVAISQISLFEKIHRDRGACTLNGFVVVRVFESEVMHIRVRVIEEKIE